MIIRVETGSSTHYIDREHVIRAVAWKRDNGITAVTICNERDDLTLVGKEADKFLDAFAGSKREQFEAVETAINEMTHVMGLSPTKGDGDVILTYYPKFTSIEGKLVEGMPIKLGGLSFDDLELISSALSAHTW